MHYIELSVYLFPVIVMMHHGIIQDAVFTYVRVFFPSLLLLRRRCYIIITAMHHTHKTKSKTQLP